MVMSIQDLSFLLAEGPAELLDRPLDDYADLLRKVPEIEPEPLEAIDYAVRHTVLRLLIRAAGREELAAAYDALRRLVPVEKEKALAAWLPRWRAFADLLDSRLAVLAAQDPAAARKLAHAGRIFELLEDAGEPGLKQGEILSALGLKPANLSRILAVLEAHELIERRTMGRQKTVHLGRLAAVEGISKGDRRVGAEPADPYEVKSGHHYLTLAAA
jgi:DNA-binding transcriptional ArsR family regulator